MVELSFVVAGLGKVADRLEEPNSKCLVFSVHCF